MHRFLFGLLVIASATLASSLAGCTVNVDEPTDKPRVDVDVTRPPSKVDVDVDVKKTP